MDDFYYSDITILSQEFFASVGRDRAMLMFKAITPEGALGRLYRKG